MGSPFPGMDSYLEQPAFWQSFHNKFANKIQETLNPDYLNFMSRRSI